MDKLGMRWWALIAWALVAGLAGVSTWVGLQSVLLTMSHPGLASRQNWMGNMSFLIGGIAALVLAVTALAREFRR